MSGLVKFYNRKGADAQKLYWNRAEVDGVPFRGPQPPFMTEAEYETRTVRVADARNAFFNVHDPEQNKQYLEVLECCYNQWFQMVHLERFWNNSTLHYVEWVEYYMEDGTRTPFAMCYYSKNVPNAPSE